MPLSNQILDNIHTLHLLAKRTLQRRMVVLSGSKTWCFAIVNELLTHECCTLPLLISDNIEKANLPSCSSLKLSHLLGSECETLIWDGFSGLNPDGLGIASGLIKGGGLFFLLLPDLTILQTQADKDYLRMVPDHSSLNSCNTFFLQRLVSHIKQDKKILLIEESNNDSISIGRESLLSKSRNTTQIDLPTPDQISAIEAIKKVSFGHRHRPLVIKANRGRGKTSTLGIAAANIYIQTEQNFLITAPSKKTCESAFRHFKSEIESHFSDFIDIEKALTAFEFVPLDLIVNDFPPCHLLFIDEAAAIPTPILTLLVKQYSRVVFSTTIHGYEGNGQGFEIRFKQTLDAIRPQWRSISLSSPIRWLDNDPLELWFFNFLLLNAQVPIHQSKPRTSHRPFEETQISEFNTRWLTQSAIFENELVFEQLISLLVTAHYQTSPSDIRLILDHPNVHILVSHTNSTYPIESGDMKFSGNILGVCLIMEEGKAESADLANDIICGRRRPRGQLFPQSLCANSANSDFLKQTTYRVMRIAVHPSYQGQGIGSNLLRAVYSYANTNQIDSISTSYGLSTDLLSFWKRNKFQIVKLGSKVDGASGLQSIMMMKPISKQAQTLLIAQSKTFIASFIFNINRQHQFLASPIVSAIFQSFSTDIEKKTTFNLIKIKAFAEALRPYEESDYDVFEYVISRIYLPQWLQLSPEVQQILIIKVLQNRDHQSCLKHLNLSGKKQLDTALRAALRALLDTEA